MVVLHPKNPSPHVLREITLTYVTSRAYNKQIVFPHYSITILISDFHQMLIRNYREDCTVPLVMSVQVVVSGYSIHVTLTPVSMSGYNISRM